VSDPLVSCLTVTYGRPLLLGEAVKCFLDQDYENKELIILNDQEGVTLKIDDCPDNIKIYNHPTRFNSLGEKRNYLTTLANGDYYCIWDDDDLYTFWRISASVEIFRKNKYVDIVKSKYALMSIDNQNYMMVANLFHSQACIGKKYMDKTEYPNKSVGEDIAFESGARIGSFDLNPYFWYVYRWGLNIHHLSGISDDKASWEKSVGFEPYTKVQGEVIIEPKFENDYWKDIGDFLETKSKKYANEWREKIKDLD